MVEEDKRLDDECGGGRESGALWPESTTHIRKEVGAVPALLEKRDRGSDSTCAGAMEWMEWGRSMKGLKSEYTLGVWNVESQVKVLEPALLNVSTVSTNTWIHGWECFIDI